MKVKRDEKIEREVKDLENHKNNSKKKSKI